MVFVFLWFISLSEYPYFEIHPYFCKWKDFILLYDWEGFHCGASQVALVAKNPPVNAGDVRDSGSIPGLGRPLEEGIAIHSSILAWRVPWTEEPGRLQSIVVQRVGHDWSDSACVHSGFHCIDTSHLLYPLNYQWTLKLVPCLDCCK